MCSNATRRAVTRRSLHTKKRNLLAAKRRGLAQRDAIRSSERNSAAWNMEQHHAICSNAIGSNTKRKWKTPSKRSLSMSADRFALLRAFTPRASVERRSRQSASGRVDAKSASSFAESGDVNLASGTSASQTSGRVSIHTSTGSRGGDIDLVVGTGESSSSGSVFYLCR